MKKIVVGGIILILILSIAVVSLATGGFGRNLTTKEKEQVLENRVEEGIISQEEADKIKEELEACDGTGTQKIGQKYSDCPNDGICSQLNDCSYSEAKVRMHKNQAERQDSEKDYGFGARQRNRNMQ